MIQVTRLNGKQLWVSADLIEFIEAMPDTYITLTTGEKIIVLEKPEALRDMIVDYKRRCFGQNP